MRCNNCTHYDVCYQYDITDEDDNEMCALYESKRPHGEWIEHRTQDCFGSFHSEYECSNCHYDVWQKTECSFCPNCGADMRKEGEKNEHDN